VRERLRYFSYFLQHAAVAAMLTLVRRRRRRPARADGRLRAVLISAYPPGHYGTVSRFTRWLPHLAAAGIDAEVLTPASDDEWAGFETGEPAAVSRYYRATLANAWRNLRRARDADVVVLHRGVLPFSPWQRPTFERRLARLNPHIVYDFYDAIWLQRQDAHAAAGSRLASWLHPPDKIERIMSLARVVTVSNEALGDFARAHHRDVRVIPMLLEPADYDGIPAPANPLPVLGWMGNRHQLPRLRSLAPALAELAATRDFVVRVVAAQEVEMPGVRVESLTHPWSPESERDDLGALDVGLLPLEDNEHDRGKSPLKLLQYSAARRPLVATPVGIDLELFKPGETFLPAAGREEWVAALARLVDDPTLRSRLGAAAREVVERNYSFASWTPAFTDALRTAAA
jgi:glycosyltransferase involved in cell wall biosynthesis